MEEVLIKDILGLTLEELTQEFIESSVERFRAKQVFAWLHRGCTDFSDMNNIPISLREYLKEHYYISNPKRLAISRSQGGTIKALYGFSFDSRVESVLLKYKFGNSICISSQDGCQMGCKFCASTLNGLRRNLSAGEMLSEVLAMQDISGEPIRHVVVMGVGEPFQNYENLKKFLQLIHSPDGFNLSYRNITVSTAGIVPRIYDFGRDFASVNLAISLHAASDSVRRSIMPIANKYTFDEVLHAAYDYTNLTRRRITMEYVMIQGVNDSEDDARLLADRLSGLLCHVNLIKLNPVSEISFKPSSQNSVLKFKQILQDKHIPVTIRRTLGDNIDAACGQLRNRREQ